MQTGEPGHEVAAEAVAVLQQGARDGEEAAGRLLADLGYPPEAAYVPAFLRQTVLESSRPRAEAWRPPEGAE